jgi:hypothetical protein
MSCMVDEETKVIERVEWLMTMKLLGLENQISHGKLRVDMILDTQG